MECNKDEAGRAKKMAEEKMKKDDYEGARKIALKAQNLYPELENISQLLSICDVHCAAQKRVFANDKDWYGILQVERLADEATVKKQYRRLALNLHPDKNRLPGAEAAFKYVSEANAVLSDPTKKSLYDNKIRVTVRSVPVNPPPHHMNKTYQFNKQYGAPSNVSNGFSNLNQHQATQSSFSVRQEMFWTSCPFCSVKYQQDRKLVRTMLTCQHCLKNFMAYEIGAQGVPMGSKWVPPTGNTVPLKPGVSQPVGFQGKAVPNLGKYATGVKTDVGSSVSREASEWCASRKAVRPETGGSKSNRAQSGTSNGDANNRETRNPKNTSRKRGRKRVVESSDSSDTSSESDLEDVTIKDKHNLNSGPGYAHFPRRSSRRRQNISYNEGGEEDDDDLPSSLKKSQGSTEDTGDKQKQALGGEYSFGNESKSESKETGAVSEKNMRAKDVDLDKEAKGRGKADDVSGDGVDAILIDSDSDLDSYSKENSDKDICNCEDPEFNDFDKDRDESCFSANQIWACYDSADGMPRFYAKVKKVCAAPFELTFSWLEADPVDEDCKKWIKEDLPVGCGGFKLGKTATTSSRLTFSHQVQCEKGYKRGSFLIYPREGEIWALFKDWDMNWSSNPENHRKYKYEIVEVLSDFVAVDGLKVCYLDKISGFVSLFQRSSKKETNSFLVGPSELYRFSHRISCYKMTGSEREGVPAGSFELDPASLPLNPDDLYYPGKANMETGKKAN